MPKNNGSIPIPPKLLVKVNEAMAMLNGYILSLDLPEGKIALVALDNGVIEIKDLPVEQ